MLDDKDVEKIVEAMKGVFPTMEEMKEVFLTTEEMKEVFPTAEMMKESFEGVATKEQFEKIDDRLKNVELKLEAIEDLRPRVKKLEEALDM